MAIWGWLGGHHGTWIYTYNMRKECNVITTVIKDWFHRLRSAAKSPGSIGMLGIAILLHQIPWIESILFGPSRMSRRTINNNFRHRLMMINVN